MLRIYWAAWILKFFFYTGWTYCWMCFVLLQVNVNDSHILSLDMDMKNMTIFYVAFSHNNWQIYMDTMHTSNSVRRRRSEKSKVYLTVQWYTHTHTRTCVKIILYSMPAQGFLNTSLSLIMLTSPFLQYSHCRIVCIFTVVLFQRKYRRNTDKHFCTITANITLDFYARGRDSVVKRCTHQSSAK